MKASEPINLNNCNKVIEYELDRYKYLVFNEPSSNLFYMKIIFPTKIESKEEEADFNKSFTQLSKISFHPALLHIINFQLRENCQPFPTITTKCQQIGTLSDVFFHSQSKTRQSFNGTKKIINLLGIASAMQLTYLNFSINKKLNPNRIFLDTNLYPHVLNYDVSKEESDEKRCINRSHAQAESIYRFGLIAYELITGKKQFKRTKADGDDEYEKEKPDLTIIENEWLQNFLKKCLSDDTFSKPQFDEVYQDLLANWRKCQSVFGTFVDENEVDKYIRNINEFLISFVKDVKEKVDKNDIESITIYAYMLFHGCGVEMDKKKSAFYFKKAADQGKTTAMHNYGFMLQNGFGVDKDYKESVRYYKMAADFGHPIAMNNYGLMLENGTGIEMNKEEAVKCYKKAAELGNLVSMSNYAFMLSNGKGIEKNKEEAFRWFKTAAEQGNHRAIYNYGRMLFDGEGTEKNVEKGLNLIKMAADQGYTLAMYSYGCILVTEEEVPHDYKVAAHYFKMAADLGDSDSMFLYGIMCDEGEGITMNKFEALKYLKMAAYLGNDEAAEEYKRISKTFSFTI